MPMRLPPDDLPPTDTEKIKILERQADHLLKYILKLTERVVALEQTIRRIKEAL